MQIQANFVYDRFATKVDQLVQQAQIMIPQNITMRMGVFFSKFARGHEETPAINNRNQSGYFNHAVFSHRGVTYTLHYGLVVTHLDCQIQITLFTAGRAVLDTKFSTDEFLALSLHTSTPTARIDSTIGSIQRDLCHVYYRLPQNSELLERAIKECCLSQVSQFKNHVNGTVKLTYYNELFKVYDGSLNYSRIFHLPTLYARLRQPSLKDYLYIGPPGRYNFEPTFNNADTYKVIGTKKELYQFIKDDFKPGSQLPSILQRLVHHGEYRFKDMLDFKVGSYDRPVITITRNKPSNYKKIHYIINNGVIKSLTNEI